VNKLRIPCLYPELMPYPEMAGEMRRAVGVLKKLTSSFEKTLREFEITRYGIKVGESLTELRDWQRAVTQCG